MILWMNEILHHPRTLVSDDSPANTKTRYGFNNGFVGGANGFRPSIGFFSCEGIDNYHGWSGWDCMAANGSCRPGIGGTAIGAQLIMIIMIIAPRRLFVFFVGGGAKTWVIIRRYM